jgi:hypothetical protein
MLEPIRNLNGLTAGEFKKFLATVDDSAPLRLRIPTNGIRGVRAGENGPVLAAELVDDWMIVLEVEGD